MDKSPVIDEGNTENMTLWGICRRGGIFLFIVLITVLSACAATREEPVLEPVPPASLGTIGVVSVRSEFSVKGPFPYTSAGEGAAKGGVAMGAAAAASPCLSLLPFLPAFSICVASFTAIGVAGGALSGDTASEVESALQVAPTSMELQDRLKSHVLARARTLTRNELIDLGPEGIEYRQPPGPGQPSPEETAETEDASAAVSEYQRFSQNNTDTVLETAIIEYATWASGNEKYGLKLAARSRLVRSSDGVVIGLATHDFASPSYTLAQWTDNDAELLRTEIQNGIDSLAADIARYHLPVSTS